jgi:transglutaminase-like putative cysteine protease
MHADSLTLPAAQGLGQPGGAMLIRLGCRMQLTLPQPTPLIALLRVHDSRNGDMALADAIATLPIVPISGYRDGFGNLCARMVAPEGLFMLSTNGLFRDGGQPDPVLPAAGQHAVQDLPAETLVYLQGSRYCDTDLLSDEAWHRFGQTPPGWSRVQAVCDFVHERIRFGYHHARATRTASQALAEGYGVCRDYAHLAIALCRCLNIPARYCTGYLGDFGETPPYGPGDFAAWMEVYLDDGWRVFDPRNHKPRIGRVLVARGRDAADVSLTQTFGAHVLTDFLVWTDKAGPEDLPREGMK